MEEKQSISSGEVGSLEDVLGKNDPMLRSVLEPDPELEPEPGPIDFNTPEGQKRFREFKARKR